MYLIINKTTKAFYFADKLYGELPTNSVAIANYTKPTDVSLYVVNATNDGLVIDEVFELSMAKTAKLKEIEDDYLVAEEIPVIINHASIGEITYYGGCMSARSIRDYIDLNRLNSVIVHKIWGINKLKVDHSEAEADEVMITVGGRASIDKNYKNDRERAVLVATSIAEVGLV